MAVDVKICGLSTGAAVSAAVEAGADFLGFVFYPPSPRAIVPEHASVLGQLVPRHVRKVALVVDAADSVISDIVETARPDMLQCHGAETPQQIGALKARFGLPVIKALSLSTRDDIGRARLYEETADYLRFDARPRPDQLPGGNGEIFDWTLLTGVAFEKPWFLSGGLNAANLDEALRLSGAKLVDVSSGVERQRGEKDVNLIRMFIQSAKKTREGHAA